MLHFLGEPLGTSCSTAQAPLIHRTVVQMAACFWYFPLDSWAPKRDCLPGRSAQLRRNCLVLELLLSITSTNHNCTAGKRTLAASWRPLPCHFQNDILLSTRAGRKNGNLHHTMRLNPYLIPDIKCNSKCIKDPSVGAKTIEPLQDTKKGFVALNGAVIPQLQPQKHR